MTVIVLLRCPGAGKGTQAPSSRSSSGSRSSRPATSSGPPSRDGTPLGREAERYMDRGQLVPDDVDRRLLLDRLDQPDARRRDPRRLPPHAGPGRGPRRGAREAGPAGRPRRATSTCRPRTSSRRMAGRWICTRERPRLQHSSRTRRRWRASATSTAPSCTSAPTTSEETVRARMAQQLPPLDEVVDHYRRGGHPRARRRRASRSTGVDPRRHPEPPTAPPERA